MKHRFSQWLRRSFASGRLRSKLLCIYFLLIVIPLGLFSLYSFFRVQDVIRDQTLSAAQNAFDDTHLSMERVFKQLDDVVEILSADPLVYTMASNDPADFSYIRRFEDSSQLSNTFQQLRTLSGVNRIHLFVNNDYLYSNSQGSIVQMNEVEDSIWYRLAWESSGKLWCAPFDYRDRPSEEQQWFSSVRTLYNPRNVKEPLAILSADLDAEQIYKLMNSTSITENGLLLLLRGNDVLHASGTEDSLSRLEALIAKLPDANGEGWEEVEVGATGYYAQCRSLGDSHWRLASILPHADIFRPSRELSIEMLKIVVIVAAVAYLLAYLISQSTLKRLSQLTNTMKAVETGDVAVRLDPVGDDEIAQLMGSFNQMMDRVDALMEKKVEYGRQIKNLELKALQAQINPHFLYNSLDLINCTAINRNVPEISRMVNALGRFYRLSLSKGREIISLSDELKHAKLYVDIQNMRFENSISVTWDLDPACNDCRIIKIILQPLIENAMIHGIFEKPAKTGRLSITTRRSDDGIRITIEDDGIGMDEATRLANFSVSSPGEIAATAGGYGVRNIQDRLRLAYGEPYGLFCESTPGQGSVVTVYIPAIEQEN